MDIEQKRQLLIETLRTLPATTLEDWIEDNLDLYETIYNAANPTLVDEEGFDCGFEDLDSEEFEEDEEDFGYEHDDDFGEDNGQDW